MKIIETDSTIVFENATQGIIHTINNLPWNLFYYEIKVSNQLVENTFYPSNGEIDIAKMNTFIEKCDEDNDVKINVTLYFNK